MHKRLKRSKKLETLDAKMAVVKKFIDVFYDETLFKNDKKLATDLPSSHIKSIFSFPDENNTYPIGELAVNVRVKRSTMTDMVDRLERDGIAERFRDNSDRRVVKVRLTNKGKKIRNEFIKKRRLEFQSLFSQLKEEDTLHLIYYLDEAAKILNKVQ